MPSILSQREIDALLSALPVEDAASTSSTSHSDSVRVGKPVKTYDFRHPSKFSRDQVRTLEFLHETFAHVRRKAGGERIEKLDRGVPVQPV